MLNNKLKAISKLVNKEDVVVDIGCDHAYLAIYLKENEICKEAYASDISENVLKVAKNNIKKSKVDVEVFLSDGFLNIKNNDINTAIISGMGASTIINIIKKAPLHITKYIISSNNEHEELRKFMLKNMFYIKTEIVIKEKDKYYPIMLFTNEKQKESSITLKYGKSNNKEYYKYLENKEKEILKKIPIKHVIVRFKHKINIKALKKIQKIN